MPKVYSVQGSIGCLARECLTVVGQRRLKDGVAFRDIRRESYN
jgi:hypothetical protein